MGNKKKWNVLVFPGGTEIGLEIFRALRYCKEVTLFSASNNVVNHAEYVFENHMVTADVSNPKWVDDINQIIEDFEIDFIYPAHSYVIDAIVKAISVLKAKVILADLDAIRITRSKDLTLAALKGIIPLPKTYSKTSQVEKFPVFLKPKKGYGSQAISTIHSMQELLLRDIEDYLLQEFLPGEEYTIDCFSTLEHKLLFCKARTRERIRMGTSMHSELVDDELQQTFMQYAELILKAIPLTGGWFFQMKKDCQGELRLLEVEARIAGTMALNRALGVNFPLLSLYQAAGMEVKVFLNSAVTATIDRSLKNAFKTNLKYDVVYVDLDDTIIVHEKLNLEIIKFLYQCVNKKIKIILLSKSLAADKVGELKKWRIYELFDEIVWLNEADSKSKYIINKSAIFIDDSYSQRVQVAHDCHIPVFDSSMVEILSDNKS